jgi:uncharacterized protein (DUF1778 family)
MPREKRLIKTERVSVYLTPDMSARVHLAAEQMGLSVSSYLLMAAADFMKQADALNTMKQLSMYDLLGKTNKG